ncbi:neuronal acetylcholine receptor subunit alpha-9 [Engraulis encrasicolus]|uniref:neuronal acetylcholine receptor subunit alpha-9 n=1 Tax=Engraulis encrasicolus TaxID=184585 RepID=UPI002FD4B6A2
MISPSQVVTSAKGFYAQKLMTDLMENYSNALRPVEDTDAALNVTLQVTLSQIKDMDERNQVLIAYLWIRQTWHDPYLKWNKEDYDGLEVIRIPSSLVWRPDIVLYNKADDEENGPMETNVKLRYDGEIIWDTPSITKSSCVVDVSYFPFDYQECNLTFGSWTYNGNQVDIIMGMDSGDLSDFVENVEWVCHGMPAQKNVIMYGCCSDPYPDITYTVKLQRRSSFYIFNLLVPCFLISFLAPLSFYLPADSGEKVSLGVTVLLALTVFQLMVAESMPPSESVPLIGKYYVATMTMITASTTLTIFIMNIHFCGAEAKPVPQWAKALIIDYLAKIFFVYEVGENCTSPQDETHEDHPFFPNMDEHKHQQADKHHHYHRLHQNEKNFQRHHQGRNSHPHHPQPNGILKGPGGPEGKKGSLRYNKPGSPPLPNIPEDDFSILKPPVSQTYDGLNGSKTCLLKEVPPPTPCCPDEKKPPSSTFTSTTTCSCRFCSSPPPPSCWDEAFMSPDHAALMRNVEYITNCFREQRSTCIKVAEWKRVAKVMDRFFMWIFFAMVFIMSIIIMAKAESV